MDDPLRLVGTTLEGKYRIDSVVAAGGFALVYRATHLVWQRPVAVKAFYALAELPEASRAKLVEEFLREGALLAELSERSAAIVQARDVGTLTTSGGDKVPYTILEWLDGATLEAVLRDERERGLPLRTPAEMVSLLDPVAEALALAHRKGIAHRDVKPQNIFILGDARAPHCTLKLLDFGIAKVVLDAQKMGGSFQKTSGNLTSFTPAYGAPEQFSRTHGATGPWTDVFALGLVASEVLSGKEPLSGDSFVQLGYASADPARRPTPRTLGATCSDDFERVLAKALAVVPAERYPTAGEFWNALRGSLALSPLSAPGSDSAPKIAPSDPSAFAQTQAATSPATTAPTHARSSRSRTLALGGAAALVVAGAVGIVASRTHGTVRPAPSGPMMSATATPSSPCPAGAVLVPGGEFFQGSSHPPKPYLENEMPAHHVTLSPFCLDKHEVTVERYVACSDTGKCLRASTSNFPPESLTPAQHQAYDPVCNETDVAARAQHPINCVSWAQADTFCKQASGRLPTEAEWEFAARGQDGRVYPWGDDAPSPKKANTCGTECRDWAKAHGVEADFPGVMYEASDGFANTAPVGSFPEGASRYGIEDVVGNVWEWTADFYAPYASDGGSLTDPKGPTTGTERVVRGGAWNAAFPEWARPTFRYHASPDQQSYGTGFRCAYAPHS